MEQRPPQRRPEPAPAPQETRSEGRSGGWISTCLSRSSSREETPAPAPSRNAMESLDSLSVDIARMIDHDAAAELWERYKRGERNVFTRRLYTMQGQKTFEEIRKRYRSDREFKNTVDRYIGEFERLLEEVSQDERGQQVARSYLTSDTGKVYTMLAHVSGRFEGKRPIHASLKGALRRALFFLPESGIAAEWHRLSPCAPKAGRSRARSRSRAAPRPRRMSWSPR